ncbi:hypothetical protein MKZ38_008687 [Zalerion maritima]|uniref:Uncharacterized protein n=1 Tax=Zalerion maritima TaxID=339359 RepID=A0AAD5RHE0_9PEZI|nr:hypothetical protein MKZ38_008687 [Zalerion maritima]
MAITSSMTPPSSARIALSRVHPEDSTAAEIDLAEPTWWRDALNRADPNWEDPFELTKFGDIGNPSWWHPWKPRDPDRLIFPPIEEIFDHLKRDEQRRSQTALANATEKKGGGEIVRRASAGRTLASTPKPTATTEPRRSARIKARNDALSDIVRRRNPRRSARIRVGSHTQTAMVKEGVVPVGPL